MQEALHVAQEQQGADASSTSLRQQLHDCVRRVAALQAEVRARGSQLAAARAEAAALRAICAAAPLPHGKEPQAARSSGVRLPRTVELADTASAARRAAGGRLNSQTGGVSVVVSPANPGHRQHVPSAAQHALRHSPARNAATPGAQIGTSSALARVPSSPMRAAGARRGARSSSEWSSSDAGGG
jgi:hypothetical protein